MKAVKKKYAFLARIYQSQTSFIFQAKKIATNKQVMIKTLNHDFYNPCVLSYLKKEYSLSVQEPRKNLGSFLLEKK